MASDSMGKMIAMITALGEMQDRRRKLALEEDSLRAQKEQFAASMGMTEKGQKQQAAFKLIDIASKGGAAAAPALQQLGQLFNLTPEEQQGLLQYGPDATTARQLFDLAQQRAGLESMGTPNPNAQQTAQQHAYLAQQANTNPGQMAVGGLQARLANTPLTPDLAQRVGEGFVMRQATGQDPFSFAVGQAGIDQNLAPQAAAIGAGVAPSWMNKEQVKYWEMGLKANDLESQRRLQGQQQGAGIDMGSYASLVNAAHAIQNDIAQGKYANDDYKKHAIGLYNNMARMLGLDLMTDENAPKPTGAVKQGINKIGGMNYPGVDTTQRTSVNPMYRPPNFF